MKKFTQIFRNVRPTFFWVNELKHLANNRKYMVQYYSSFTLHILVDGSSVFSCADCAVYVRLWKCNKDRIRDFLIKSLVFGNNPEWKTLSLNYHWTSSVFILKSYAVIVLYNYCKRALVLRSHLIRHVGDDSWTLMGVCNNFITFLHKSFSRWNLMMASDRPKHVVS
jgi:hypothetical protein